MPRVATNPSINSEAGGFLRLRTMNSSQSPSFRRRPATVSEYFLPHGVHVDLRNYVCTSLYGCSCPPMHIPRRTHETRSTWSNDHQNCDEISSGLHSLRRAAMKSPGTGGKTMITTQRWTRLQLYSGALLRQERPLHIGVLVET